jgi:hypothetical protein
MRFLFENALLILFLELSYYILKLSQLEFKIPGNGRDDRK